MPRQELTPEELTFQSFRHSQGDPSTQQYVLAYFQQHWSLAASAELDETMLERYYRVVTSERHVPLKARPILSDPECTNGNAHRLVITDEVNGLLLSASTIKGFSSAPPRQLGFRLGESILSREIELFARQIDGTGRTLEVMADKLRRHQASLFVRHAMRSEGTGWIQLDEMYKDLASHVHATDEYSLNHIYLHHQEMLHRAESLAESKT